MDENAGTPFLTARQREVYLYIRAYFNRYGEAPTREEIQRAFQFRSPNAAQYFVEALIAKGALAHRPGERRGLTPQGMPC